MIDEDDTDLDYERVGPDERMELRAMRLAAMLMVMGEEPEMDVDDGFRYGFAPDDWDTIMRDNVLGLEPNDLALDAALAQECAGFARDFRARQWHALQHFDALLFSASPGDLSRPQKRTAGRCLRRLGWDRPAPKDQDYGWPAART